MSQASPNTAAEATSPSDTDSPALPPPAIAPHWKVQRADSLAARLATAAVLASCAAVLGLAMWLPPAAEGVGTHHRLGLPPCSFLKVTGMPCMTCGMTTAFSLAVRGRLIDSFTTQPAGAILALGTAAAFLLCGLSLATGASLSPLLSWLGRPRLVVGMGALLLGAWVYKIMIIRIGHG